LASVEREGRKTWRDQLLRGGGAAVEVLNRLGVGGAAFLLAGGVAFVLLETEAMGFHQFGFLLLDVRIAFDVAVLLVVLAPDQAGQQEEEPSVTPSA